MAEFVGVGDMTAVPSHQKITTMKRRRSQGTQFGLITRSVMATMLALGYRRVPRCGKQGLVAIEIVWRDAGGADKMWGAAGVGEAVSAVRTHLAVI
jgi:hypothetical protein